MNQVSNQSANLSSLDSRHRKIVLVAISVAIVFVWAAFTIAHPGETEVRWTVAGVGLIETKGHMFLTAGNQNWFQVPSLVAAALMSMAWVALISLVAGAVICMRRIVSRQ